MKTTFHNFSMIFCLLLTLACANNKRKASPTVTNNTVHLLPDSTSAYLSKFSEASLKFLASVKPGDTIATEYGECILADGRPAVFCIKAPESRWGGWAGTKDPDFSWRIVGDKNWAHGRYLRYQTAAQGIWETDCHAKRVSDGHGNLYFSMWLENGTPGNNHHRGDTPKFKDRHGNVWIIAERPFYLEGSKSHLSMMYLIRTNL